VTSAFATLDRLERGGRPPNEGFHTSLLGVIASAGFASGDRFVCGVWQRSPLGPIADLMWAAPDGRRRLVAGTAETAAFVSAVYGFDEVVVDPGFSGRIAAGRVVAVDAPLLGLRLRARAGRGWPIPLLGPPWVTRYLAAPVARRVMGVQTYGASPSGVREWYRARWYRRAGPRATRAARPARALRVQRAAAASLGRLGAAAAARSVGPDRAGAVLVVAGGKSSSSSLTDVATDDTARSNASALAREGWR
jgi:hypothetical protein